MRGVIQARAIPVLVDAYLVTLPFEEVDTNNGKVLAGAGDWIVRFGGQRYVYRNSEFSRLFDPIEEGFNDRANE